MARVRVRSGGSFIGKKQNDLHTTTTTTTTTTAVAAAGNLSTRATDTEFSALSPYRGRDCSHQPQTLCNGVAYIRSDDPRAQRVPEASGRDCRQRPFQLALGRYRDVPSDPAAFLPPSRMPTAALLVSVSFKEEAQIPAIVERLNMYLPQRQGAGRNPPAIIAMPAGWSVARANPLRET